jgi:hypothetical protein
LALIVQGGIQGYGVSLFVPPLGNSQVSTLACPAGESASKDVLSPERFCPLVGD